MNTINASEIERITRSFNGIREKSILQNILIFCRILKLLKIHVSMGSVLDLFKSLRYINIANKEDFYYTLKANLISCREEIPTFDLAFRLFWKFSDEMQSNKEIDERKNDEGDNSCEEPWESDKKELIIEQGRSENPEAEADEEQISEYSPVEILATKDFSCITDEEIPKIKEVIAQIVSKLATKKSRRRKLATKGDELSFRHSLRKNLKYGGEIFELAKRKRKIKKVKLIALADVSGSMDYYSKFFIQFIYGLQNRLSGVETFVFSTHLTRITALLKRRDLDEALKIISKVVLHWSGGTRIGSCLQTFNKKFAPTVLSKKSVVMIISDGWDRGDNELLESEIKRLKENCHKIIWLNPLLGSPNYQPLCKGIQAALPHLSHFLPLHNLNSLIALGKTLKSVI